MLRILAVVACFATLLSHAGASETAATVIYAGSLLDKPGAAPRGPATILVRNGRIESVSNGLQAPETGATLIDLRDRFVLPGLIDCHVHLDSDKAGVEAQLLAVTASVPAMAYEAAANARKTLLAGFTTVRNLGDTDGVTLALRDAIAAGKAIGPRIIDAGTPISATSGHMDPTLGYSDAFTEALDVHQNLCDGVESSAARCASRSDAVSTSSKSRRQAA